MHISMIWKLSRIGAIALLSLSVTGAFPSLADTVRLERVTVTDYKSVYGEVRSRKVAPARTRIGGTIASLTVREGDSVSSGETIATVGDPKISLRIEAIDARIAALESEVGNALSERDRAVDLFERNVIAKAALDRAQTAFDVVSRQLETTRAERRVLIEQLGEGEVLAPTAGRVLRVPATVGSVVAPGETIAEIAEEDYVLRLSMPERHARSIQAGGRVLVASLLNGPEAAPVEGEIVLVYPDISAGRLIADAEVPGLGDYFVGERVQAWLAVGVREAIVIPRGAVETQSGIDFVRLERVGGPPARVVVRLGPPLRDDPGRVEVLSGLRPGDAVVLP